MKKLCLRNDLGSPEIPFVYGLIYPPIDEWRASSIVREAQKTIVNKLENTKLINTDDLSKIDDCLHYDTVSLETLGKRFFNEYINIKNNES